MTLLLIGTIWLLPVLSLFTMAALYQLSYVGLTLESYRRRTGGSRPVSRGN